MDGINFIQDLAVVLLGAGLFGALCKRIGLSVIVGYLLAGIVIGPFTPPFAYVHDVARIETLAQLGLIFLMFAIGLGLSLSKLQKMGTSTLLGTALGAFFVYNLTRLLGEAVGWSPSQILFIAAMFMVSSSAVIAKVIRDMNLGHERPGQLALGVTVLEDVVAVVMLAILGSQLAAASGGGPEELGSVLTALGAFVVLIVITGLFFVPKLLRRLEKRADPELQTIAVAGILFLIALLSVKAGYSLALGAFLLGAIVAEMPQRAGVEKSFTGMRDMFSSVFFVAIGMMIDVRLMIDVWPWILGLGLFTMVARAVSLGLALILVGASPQDARRAGLALTPLGEFTFVIAQLGVSAHVLPPEYYPIAVGVSILTVLVAPVLNRHADPVLHVIAKAEPRWLRRLLRAYHHWVTQLGTVKGGRLWWQMSRKRLIQVALEILFVTGLLIFSERILAALQQSSMADAFSPEMLRLSFWLAIVLLVAVPLVAIWRNVTTVAMILAEVAGSRTRVLGPLVENGFKVFSALAIAYWIFHILPVESLSRWAWLVIAAVLVAVLVTFSRRLVYWNSEWENSLREVLAENDPGVLRQQQLMARSGDWDIHVQEFVLPENAACSGHGIDELQVRSRFGCSIVEVDRQGHTIIAPDPAERLYSGDRLLLLGTLAQIAAAREGLGQVKGGDAVDHFDEAGLETVNVPEGPRAGRSLAELQIPKEVGILVAGIHRGGRKIVSPAGNERLEEGDQLLVLGSPEQIRRFRDWLSPLAQEGGLLRNS